MKLFYSGGSPFVRKVLACAIARDIRAQIDLVPIDPWAMPPELLAQNPLSKIPCLVTDDGLALFDSPLICEYLDSVGNEAPLFPAQHAARWRALKYQAIGDGIMDASVIARLEGIRPDGIARQDVLARQLSIVGNALDLLETAVPAQHVDIGSLTVSCALGYLDYRHAALSWRENRPHLAAWAEEMAARPEIRDTAPPGA